MQKQVYVIEIISDNENNFIEFENWLFNVVYNINIKTLDRNIIVEFTKWYNCLVPLGTAASGAGKDLQK